LPADTLTHQLNLIFFDHQLNELPLTVFAPKCPNLRKTSLLNHRAKESA